ncbi:MAG TPA: TolC family protein [Gemmataceae bacterium]|nr:TolC family protein [Gemmataceae bacterium]
MKAGAAIGGATLWRCLAGLGYLLALAACLRAQQPAPVLQPVEQKLPSLTVGNVIAYALQNNPGLAVKRHERGIASARVVIANTYPFNPVSENRIQAAFTPNDPASTTFNAPVENLITWEVEVRQQRRIRKEMAAASLTRTEWEIAFEEQTVAIQVIRAFYNVVYRQQKLELLEKTLRVNQRLVEDVERLIKTGKLRLPDKIVAQIEVSNTQDQLASGHEALTAAWQDLYRAMGPVGGFEIMGHLELPPLAWNPAELCDLAVTRRADVNARRLAISEASAKTRLTVANRFGNPVVGPAFAYDNTNTVWIGVQVNVPLPFPNTHKGEILESQAEQAQAAAQLRQAEVTAMQDVAAALSRIEKAQQTLELLRTQTLPARQQAFDDMERLFQAGEPGLDILKVIDVRRQLLLGQGAYLDALLSVRQARADLLAATGEPVLDLCAPEQLPAPPLPKP